MVSTNTAVIGTFSASVRRNFDFLEPLGFVCELNELDRLIYVCRDVIVSIFWDRRSGEITEFIGLRSKSSAQILQFEISDILAMERAPLLGPRMPYQIYDEARIAPFVEKLAQFTQQFAQRALDGDHQYFERLDTFRRDAARTEMLAATLRRVRKEVADAWQARDYGRVVMLLGPVDIHLSAVDRKKLEYAQLQLLRAGRLTRTTE